METTGSGFFFLRNGDHTGCRCTACNQGCRAGGWEVGALQDAGALSGCRLSPRGLGVRRCSGAFPEVHCNQNASDWETQTLPHIRCPPLRAIQIQHPHAPLVPESGAAAPQSKTLARCPGAGCLREVLECAGAPALSLRFTATKTRPIGKHKRPHTSVARLYAPSRSNIRTRLLCPMAAQQCTHSKTLTRSRSATSGTGWVALSQSRLAGGRASIRKLPFRWLASSDFEKKGEVRAPHVGRYIMMGCY